MVTPSCKGLGDSLAGDALGSLKHIVVLTGELHICTNPRQSPNKKSKLFIEVFLKKKNQQSNCYDASSDSNSNYAGRPP
jgi:hypothetical protein